MTDKLRTYETDYYGKTHINIHIHFHEVYQYDPVSGFFKHTETNSPAGVIIDNRRCIKIWGKYYLMGDVAWMLNGGWKGELPTFGALQYINGNRNDFRQANLTLDGDMGSASEDALQQEVRNKFYLEDGVIMWTKFKKPAGHFTNTGIKTIALGGIQYDLETIKKMLE